MFFEKNPSPCNKTFMLSARLFLSFMYFYVRAAAVKSCGFYFYNMLRDIDTKCIVIKMQVHAMGTAVEMRARSGWVLIVRVMGKEYGTKL
jgi:hypothetical protein